jgi:hypothetical protein
MRTLTHRDPLAYQRDTRAVFGDVYASSVPRLPDVYTVRKEAASDMQCLDVCAEGCLKRRAR